MTREDQVVALFVRANPVVDADALASKSAARLTIPESWSEDMQDTTVRDIDIPLGNRRRWVGAVAAAAAVIIAVGAVGILMAGGEDPVAEPPQVEAVLAYFEAANSGDLEAFNALRSPELAAADPSMDQVLINLNTRTRVDSCTYAGPSPTGGDLVRCEVASIYEAWSGRAGVELPHVRTMTVAADGTIVADDQSDTEFIELRSFNIAFWVWLRTTYGGVYEDITPSEGGALPGFRTDPADVFIALEYVDEFIAQSDVYPLDAGG